MKVKKTSMSKILYKKVFRINKEISKVINELNFQDEKNLNDQEKKSKDENLLQKKENHCLDKMNKINYLKGNLNDLNNQKNSIFSIQNNKNIIEEPLYYKKNIKRNILFNNPDMNIFGNYENKYNPIFLNYKINNLSFENFYFTGNTNNNSFNYIRKNNIFNQYDYNNKFELKKKAKNLDVPRNKINLENILRQKDKRTTIMIRHIPNKYSLKLLTDEINEKFKNKYNLIYLPIDRINCCNLGFGFINFTNILHILSFYFHYYGKKWKRFNSDKKCELVYGKIQGKEDLFKYIQQNENYNNEKNIPIYYLNDNNSENQIILPLQYIQAFLSFYPNASYHLIDNQNFIIDSFYNF